MKNYFRISINWLKRLGSYGLGNTLRLKRYLKREGLFSLRYKEYDFFLRGNTVDFDVFNGIFVKKEYETELPFSPSVIIDGGANIGASTLFFRMKYPQAHIYAIEPESSNFELLRKNLSVFPRITLINSAIWDRDADLSIANPDAEKYAFQVDEQSGKGMVVRGVSVESLMQEYNLAGIDLLKLDIEGAERFLFNRADIPWLAKTGVIMIELHESLYPGVTEAFFKAIGNADNDIRVNGENVIVINKSYKPYQAGV